MKKNFDVVVIGAGSGGLTAAVGFTKAGKTVALIEAEHMGGECTNSGCIPSKALLHHAKQFHAAKVIAGDTEQSAAYRSQAFTYVKQIRDRVLAEETPETFADMGIEVVKGQASFGGPCFVKVGETEYHYKHAVIATGSTPRPLDIEGLSEKHILTNQNIFELETVPGKTLIIGSGPIGLEMGQALAMLGSEVIIVTRDSEFAKLEDPAIRPILEQHFTSLGITLHKNAHVSHVEDTTAHITITSVDGDPMQTVTTQFDKTLIAIGRVPNFPTGLDVANIARDEQQIFVDSQCRTANKYVYAVGDVAQKLKFTHTADDRARQVVKRVVSKGLLRVNKSKSVPKVTYTAPEVAQVGLSWQEAKTNYREEQLFRIEVPFSQNDRATTDSATDGLLIVIARRLNGAILGAHIIGPHAGELITTFGLAIDEKISLFKLQRLIIAYPTYSLVIKKAGDQFLARQITSLKSDVLALIKRHLPQLIAGLFWLTLIYQFQQYKIATGQSYREMLYALHDFFTMSMYGPLIYITLYAIRPLIFFPATLLTALSGILFGFWWGVIYTVIGENASANFAYWIGRFFGKDLHLEDSVIGNWITSLRNNTFEAVLLLRLFYAPFDLTNYGSGIVKANWKQYFFATLIGIMPGLTTFVALGAAVDFEEYKTMGLSFDVLDPKFLALSGAIFIISLGLSRLLKRWRAE